MIRIGTSGYSYDDWVGPFYPPGLKKNDFLSFYAKQFGTTELNFSFYRMPNALTLERMAAKTRPDFLFSIKATRTITHERTDDPSGEFAAFVDALTPLKESGKLACVLAQFPYSFHATDENRDYLGKLRDGFGDNPVVVEFRNRQWITDETFDLLRRLELGFCCVDQPRLKNLVPPVAVASGPVAYLRFHGRNYGTWWEHDEAWQRYDYEYSADELGEWVPKVRQLDEATSLTLVYMNNHWRGQAVASARLMGDLLGS